MRRSRVVLAATGAIALVGGVGTASATALSTASPVDSSGVVHGCLTTAAVKGSHAIVLQDSGTPCPGGTTAVTWNQVGPTGATGPAGPQGPKGDTGPAGPQGVKGDTGAAGTNGVDGAAGAAGPAGQVGPAGPQGDTGPAGPQGPKGDTGAPGASGLLGAHIVVSSVEQGFADVYCPAGEVATGGGGETNGNGLSESAPVIPTAPGGLVRGWAVRVVSPSTDNIVTAWVVCVPVPAS